jgi:hypothetical protein
MGSKRYNLWWIEIIKTVSKRTVLIDWARV